MRRPAFILPFSAKLAAELDLAQLSMGMSADFETAIHFGATHVACRLGNFRPTRLAAVRAKANRQPCPCPRLGQRRRTAAQILRTTSPRHSRLSAATC